MEAGRAGMFRNKWNNYVGILQDEIHVNQELVYNKHSGELNGFTNLEGAAEELNDFKKDRDNRRSGSELATHILVLMVRGATSSLKNLRGATEKRNPNLAEYCHPDDPRLRYLLEDFWGYFNEWERSVNGRLNFSKQERNKMLLSHQTIAAYTLQIEEADSSPRLVVGSQNKTKELSWDEWISACNVFQGIYSQTHPEASLQLAKHFTTVRQLQSKNQGWRFYDRNFRKLVSKELVRYGENQSELLDEARHMAVRQAVDSTPAAHGRRPRQPTANITFPIGACSTLRATASGSCQFGLNCRWQHQCFNCGGSHAFCHCSQLSNTSTPFEAVHGL
ncbi:hypothetical protein BaRGS_00015292 [Batillaria attramentaria]|uniref:Transposable element P transposase-like RNase H domain-containing protein n=1 Tax=Batillaria attramentaria TaxID=370345 RepID=A0ABD0L2W3_9CAEN